MATNLTRPDLLETKHNGISQYVISEIQSLDQQTIQYTIPDSTQTDEEH